MSQNCGINVNETLTPNGTLKKIMKSLFNLMVPLNINGGLILIMKSALIHVARSLERFPQIILI
jgi:hypothetical protein